VHGGAFGGLQVVLPEYLTPSVDTWLATRA
jgi:hypothetical protein